MEDLGPDEQDGKDRNFVTALARGLEILRCFGENDLTLTNSEIADRTGLPKATISRLTHTLCELDYLADLGVGRVPMASNSVSVQVQMVRQGAGVGVVHDFSLPFVPGVRRILREQVHLTRAFYLIRHADDQRNPRLSRFAESLSARLRTEVATLEAKA